MTEAEPSDWRDRLLPAERALLATPAVRALSEAEQRRYLTSNRRVGFWVTLLAGGAPVLMLLGAGVTAALFALERSDGLLKLLGVPLLLLGVWVLVQWAQRLAALRRSL